MSMDIRIVVRFWAAAAALFLTSQAVGSLTVTPLGALSLSALLAGTGSLSERLWPETGPGGPGLLGWVVSAGLVYMLQFPLPIYHVTAIGAVAVGGLLFILDQLTPIFFR